MVRNIAARSQHLVLLFSLAFAACSGGHVLPLQPPSVSAPGMPGSFIRVAGENEPVELATPAAPYAGTAAATQIQASTVRGVMAAVTAYDRGGQTGVMIHPAAATGSPGIYVSMTAYDGVQLNEPADSGVVNALYAPTTHGPNGDCFELTTAYWRPHNTAQTLRYVRLYDFCENGGTWKDAFDKRIDASFVKTYVRVFVGGSGRPEYTTEQLRAADGKWHVLIYNYSSSVWEDWGYSNGGTTTAFSGEGWSIFETHYAPGECSSLPAMAADGLLVFTNTGWRPIDATTAQRYDANLDCFANPTGTYYAANIDPSYSRWVVDTRTR